MSWTDRLGHKFPSQERVKHSEVELMTPLEVPIGRESPLQQAGLVFLDMAKDLLEENVRLMYARRSLDPDSLKTLDERVNLCRALGCSVKR